MQKLPNSILGTFAIHVPIPISKRTEAHSHFLKLCPHYKAKNKIVGRTLKIAPLEPSRREDSKSGLKNDFRPFLSYLLDEKALKLQNIDGL